jgi:predicted transcriptional regulator
LHFSDTGPLRRYDPAMRRLDISARAQAPTRRFQLLHQVALLTQNDLLEATLDLARFSTPEARDIAKIGLANYFAGAALLPYRAFLQAARTRHDLERLADIFGASIEQVAHRLSTLQRPGAKGIPFFFVRVDQAGTITKRHSATRLQFARFGGACPLWNVHRPLKRRGNSCANWPKPRTACAICAWRATCRNPGRRLSGPGAALCHRAGLRGAARPELVYSDGLDLKGRFEPIGISCRICERRDCHQRSVPPLERRLRVNPERARCPALRDRTRRIGRRAACGDLVLQARRDLAGAACADALPLPRSAGPAGFRPGAPCR